MRQIDDFISNADFLPPAFQLLPRLLLLLDDVEANADALADLIRVDPGLTADILRVCNSARYGLTYRAENIQQAILRIGFQEVHRIVMTVITSPALKDPSNTYQSSQTDLWNHSLAAAVSSQSLAESAQIDTDLAFTSALLHDIGKVVLSHALQQKYADVVKGAAERNQPLFLAEREAFKTDHAIVGGRLLDRWGFPKNISTAIRNHHEPAKAKDEVRLASCIYLSNVLAYHVQNVQSRPEYVIFPDSAALQELGLTQPALQALAPEAREALERAQQNFI